jgi:hypothetical protein
MTGPHHYLAFDGSKRIASGTLRQVALKARQLIDTRPYARVLVFDGATSELIDFDNRGTPEQMLQRLPPDMPQAPEPQAVDAPAAAASPTGPGRPKLGVVAREVTLLPRHWEWLNRQSGGASVALRKLVEEARRTHQSKDNARAAQEATYRFMSTMAGDRPGFEEAARALFAHDSVRFHALLEPWPEDISGHLAHLSQAAFEGVSSQDVRHA